MRVLLLRPKSPNERFGLGPFFRVEPLGLEYIASALRSHGHEVVIADLRFGPSLESMLRTHRPRLVGIASLHTLDMPSALATARVVRRLAPQAVILLGGHAAVAFPSPLFDASVDAIALDDGELVTPRVADAVDRGRPLSGVGGLLVRKGSGDELRFEPTPRVEPHASLDEVPLPSRDLVAAYQSHYLCVHKSPIWAVETTRGCPYRCNFCSIWKVQERSFRMRGIEAVVQDLAAAGPDVFVIDDLFFHPRARSEELARALSRRGLHKDWVLVQSRLDTVGRNPELLARWRPLATHFDIFFGFEAPTDAALRNLDKDFDLAGFEAGIRVAREAGFGVTGNFVVDPDWDEPDFQAMWDLVDRLKLTRAGYTIQTPLPGTPLFDRMESRIVEKDWSKYDMHHILFEPRLGRRRFFELFARSWKRNVLSSSSSPSHWLRWMRQVRVTQMVSLGRALLETQRNMSAEALMREAFPLQIPAGVSPEEP